jgi:endonuclease/exonuclease/phosphatase family metal-dependent hydrolase
MRFIEQVCAVRGSLISAARSAARAALATGLLAASACTGARLPDVATTSQAQQAITPVRVMSFNIRYGTAQDAEHAWPLRRALLFRAIREAAPVVLGVQEALRFQLDEIQQELLHYGMAGVGRDDGIEKGEYSSILFDRRQLDLLEQATFWLSDTPNIPGSTSWGNRITRIATWARFRERTTGFTFFVFNTHWDHESQPARERSARLLIERIRARSPAHDPVLLMGDFNAGEDNVAFQTLLAGSEAATASLRLYDTFRALHPQARETGTYHAFRGDRSGAKIDAILASAEWRTIDARIILLSENGRYPSDHFPVTATLTLRSRPPPRSNPP